MFEKEAEEYAEGMAKYYESAHGSVPSQFEKYLRKAVEYGYNKANEWHYVKDELPDEGTYLVVWQNDKGYKEILIMNYEEDDEEELHWIDDDCEVQDEYIIAWKELPGFPKESEK